MDDCFGVPLVTRGKKSRNIRVDNMLLYSFSQFEPVPSKIETKSVSLKRCVCCMSDGLQGERHSPVVSLHLLPAFRLVAAGAASGRQPDHRHNG